MQNSEVCRHLLSRIQDEIHHVYFSRFSCIPRAHQRMDIFPSLFSIYVNNSRRAVVVSASASHAAATPGPAARPGARSFSIPQGPFQQGRVGGATCHLHTACASISPIDCHYMTLQLAWLSVVYNWAQIKASKVKKALRRPQNWGYWTFNRTSRGPGEDPGEPIRPCPYSKQNRTSNFLLVAPPPRKVVFENG